MRKILTIVFIGLFFLFLIFGSITAQCTPDMCENISRIEGCCPKEGLVPCGGICCPCELCDTFTILDRIIDFFLFYIVPPLAALMVAIGGFMMVLAYVGPGMPEKKGPAFLSQSRTLFKAVIIGLIIVYGAWLVVEAFFAAIGVKPWAADWNVICGSF